MRLIQLFISKNNLNIDKDELRPVYESHPLSQDLLAFNEVLHFFGIDTILGNIPNTVFKELPKNFVSVIIKKGLKETVVIEKVKPNYIKLYFEDGNTKKLNLNDFFSIWSGIVLCLKTSEVSRLTIKDRFKFDKLLIYVSMVGVAFFGVNNWINNFYSFFIFIISLAGLFLVIKLIKSKYTNVESNNYRICSLLPKENCELALNFDSSFFWGYFSLLDLALVYFSSVLFILLFLSPVYLGVIFLFSCTSLVFVIYSIYLQAFRLHAWCIYCLGISTVLLSKFFFLLFIYNNIPPVNIMTMTTTLILLIFMATIWSSIRYILTRNTNLIQEEIRLHALLRKINISELNFKISKYKIDPEKIKNLDAILMGNHNAAIQLFCILSIDCDGCRKAYHDMLKISNRSPNDFCFKLILTVKNNDPSNTEIKIFERIMELHALKDNAVLFECLDDIFTNYTTQRRWLKKWKLPQNNYMEILEKNKAFLKINNIKNTPLLFLNASSLSFPFNIRDLSYMTKGFSSQLY